MFPSPTARRQDDRPSARRRRAGRRPLVEDLEGRRLLSAIHRHPGAPSGEFVGQHLVGSVSEAAGGSGSSAGTDTVRFFEL